MTATDIQLLIARARVNFLTRQGDVHIVACVAQLVTRALARTTTIHFFDRARGAALPEALRAPLGDAQTVALERSICIMPIVETIVLAVGKAAVSKLVEVGLSKALGIKVNGATVSQWGETLVLAIFVQGSLVPEPTFEQKVEKKFRELQQQVDELRQDLNELKKDMTAFEWKVESQFYEAREESLWEKVLNIDNSVNTYYSSINELADRAHEKPEDRLWYAVELANNIKSNVKAHVANTRMALLGDDVGAGSERVRGFLEIWKQQALRDADLGWKGKRLGEIYSLLESKFTRALLIQVKCVRLLMEAYEATHREGSSKKGAVDYFVDEYYPVLKQEVEGFRDLVESLAIQLIPLPTGQMLPLNVPDEITGMLAALDVFTAQALSGKVSEHKGRAPAASRQLPEVPALAGVWGRVVVPGTRWIRRAPGAKEEARVTFTPPGGHKVSCKGTLEVRAIKYEPYKGQGGTMLHKGYQLQVGTEPRDMDKMLLAHFTPTDVLPHDLAGEFDVKLEDQTGDVLAQTKAYVIPIPVDEKQTTKAPYGTFTMSFTGGAGVRGR
jgi:hypothetical protein